MEILAESTAVALIKSPIEAIDLTEWLFTLKDHEYQACSVAHIACGSTFAPDGKRMSINVEQVGESLLVQHYTEQISERSHCRVHSMTNSISGKGRTALEITWELSLRVVDAVTSELSNHVIVQPTESLLTLLRQADIIDLSPVKAAMQQNLAAHNKEETPLFANNIETKA